ncbi:helix-turn-helix domain-containing protein [Shewanella donghaensis]|uniref:helix-turn-helix domain-containing protein n=1 Tax=Shewanella donghaensis TaxID=238836 RepID=UPI001183938F|nr:helix-turn-helix transcriptional regulator [Shewanella donghaensis]
MRANTFKDIAEYIVTRRSESGDSQESLAIKLAAYDVLFENLDSLTISRWERGKISPNLIRQVSLIEFFNDQPQQLLCDAAFELKQLPSINSFLKMMGQQLNYNHVMGAHPYISQDTISFDKLSKNADEAESMYGWIANYHTNLTKGREIWSKCFIKSLAQADSTDVSFYLVDGLLAGHIFIIKVSEPTFDALSKNQLNDQQLTPEHLIPADEPGCLYMLSTYLGGKHVTEDFLSQLLVTLAETKNNIAFGYKARSDIGVKLMDFLSGEVVHVGEALQEKMEGAKYQGKRRSYVSFKLRRQSLISSSLFLNLTRSCK